MTESVQLLARDVSTTLGAAHEWIVERYAEDNRAFELALETYLQRVVDDVQQYIHDTYVDTTWPACPRHRQHPLWFGDGAWWCDADNVIVASLGALRG